MTFISVLVLCTILSFYAGFFYGPTPFALVVKLSQYGTDQTFCPQTTKRHPTKNTADLGKKHNGTEAEDHQPAGQHLLVDMKGVDADFLRSESRLAEAMMEAVGIGGLSLLSYHCHSLMNPVGVSCMGVLLESHFSIHTWPDDGVIVMDLFTCGESPLMPLLPIVKDLFGKPGRNTTTGEDMKVETIWNHELRGFRPPQDSDNILGYRTALSKTILTAMEFYQKEILSVRSEFQQIDIWESADEDETPSHSDGMKHNLSPGDPLWLSYDLATPERFLFLDGYLHNSNFDMREHHEVFVHPAMMAHCNPKNVAILGGGDGHALREVLKHKSVESVTVIEQDPLVIEVVREHFKASTSCDDLEFSETESCFDDPRVKIIFEDAIAWFIETYGKKSSEFDVIFIDISDLQVLQENVKKDKFMNNLNFLNAIYKSLSPDGFIVTPLGSSPTLAFPKLDVMEPFKIIEEWLVMLENHPSTATMKIYVDGDITDDEGVAFLLCGKAAKDLSEYWYSPASLIDHKISLRTYVTRSGEKSLIHYDGSTQTKYQSPTKHWESVYCRREPTPEECSFIALPNNQKPSKDDTVDEKFEVKKNDDGSYRVVSKVKIPKGSFVMSEQLGSSFLIDASGLLELKQSIVSGKLNEDRHAQMEKILSFLESGRQYSGNKVVVEVGAPALIRKVDKEKANLEFWKPPNMDNRPVFSPVFDRNNLSFDRLFIAKKDIERNEELLRSM